jgi:hypothetical protein
MSKVPFNDKLNPISLGCKHREEQPASLMHRPFWLLRIFKIVIKEGGYISPKIFCPKIVWGQYGVKFTALNNKRDSFEQILTAIKGCALLGDDLFERGEVCSVNAPAELRHLYNSLAVQQNNLSKPLPYIREVTFRDIATQIPPTPSVSTPSLFPLLSLI